MQSVSDLLDPVNLDDPYPLYARLRAEGGIHRITETDFYLATTHDAVHEATGRPGDFSSNLTATLTRDGIFDMNAEHHVLATADDPHHAEDRRLVLPALVAKRIRVLEPYIADASARLWHEHAAHNTIEWMSAMGDRLPMTLVAKLIGLPDDDVPQLVQWGYGSTELLGGVFGMERITEAATAATQLAGYLYEKFAGARREPGADLLGDLVRAQVPDQTALLILIQLVGAGGESTAGLVGNAARLLATDADLQRQVRAEPQLIPALLEETLRVESPFRGHHRHIRTDTTLAGTALPKDGHLLLMWGSANRDPQAHPEPDRVRLDRDSPRGHLAFGKGLHFCVGAALARTEARIAITTLLARTSWIELAEARWVPSIMVRRHQCLELNYR